MFIKGRKGFAVTGMYMLQMRDDKAGGKFYERNAEIKEKIAEYFARINVDRWRTAKHSLGRYAEY